MTTDKTRCKDCGEICGANGYGWLCGSCAAAVDARWLARALALTGEE